MHFKYPLTSKFYDLLFFIHEKNSIVYIYHILTMHSSAEGLSGCFYFLPTVNRAAVNITGQVSVEQDVKSFCIFQGVV